MRLAAVTLLYRFLLKVYPPFFGGHFSENLLFHHSSESGTILRLSLSIEKLPLMNMAGQRNTFPNLFSRQAPGAVVQATFELRVLSLSQSQ